MKNKTLTALVIAVLAIAIAFTNPSRAQAIGSLNPLCWIADQRIESVKKNCKGHNWQWPHWGGATKYDSPDRACGGGDIYSQSWWMSQSELNARNYGYLRSSYGYQWGELVLTGTIKNVLRFRHDTYTYYWQSRIHERVFYPDTGWMSWSRDEKTTAVTCDLNHHVTS